MDGTPPHQQICADHGGIAAGRDAHVHHHVACGYRPCPSCQLRLIGTHARCCKRCRRAARDLRHRRIAVCALAGFGVCIDIGLTLASRVGLDDDRWPFAVIAAVAIFCAGAWGWTKVDALRHLRRGKRHLTRLVRRGPMRAWSAMTTPSRRAPGSDEETHMEPNADQAARLAKVYAEIDKLMAETSRINAGTRWYSRIALAVICGLAFAALRFLT